MTLKLPTPFGARLTFPHKSFELQQVTDVERVPSTSCLGIWHGCIPKTIGFPADFWASMF